MIPSFWRKNPNQQPGRTLDTVQDLLDTLEAHRESCVGMAANMIGECKRIIVFDNGGSDMVMLNPEIVKYAGEYETEEACLSLLGGPRKTRRFEKRFYNKCWGQAMSLAPKLQSKVEHRGKILYHKSTTNHNKGEISMLNQNYTAKLLDLKDVIIARCKMKLRI